MDFTGLSYQIHQDNIAAGWWKVLDGVTQPRNIGELLCLVHSEISEGWTGLNQMDDHLPHRLMPEVEMADASIRVLDILGYYGVEVGEITATERAWATRGSRDFTYGLMHSMVSNAMEGFRKGRVEDGIGCLKGLLLLIVQYCDEADFDLAGAISEKRAYNRNRLDHKPENRAKAGGKAF